MVSIDRDETVPLADVLQRPFSHPHDHALFVPRSADWGLDTPCLVRDPDDVLSAVLPADDPVVGERVFEYGLAIDAVQSVVTNTRARLDNPSPDVLCHALSYYYENDAFPAFEDETDEVRSEDR